MLLNELLFHRKHFLFTSLIPSAIKLITAKNQRANKVYFANFPMDFKLVINTFKDKINKKKNGIPKAKINKIPCNQSGVSNPMGELM